MPIIPHLDLSRDKLSGPLTNLPCGSASNGLRDEYRGSLLLQNNLFNGSIPWSLCRTALEVLDLSMNMLTGEIPNCLENLKKLRGVILSYNGLSGNIPGSIGRNSLLSWLHLNDNNFTGDLPQDLRNLHDLWILDIGNNKLSGKIPEWIAELTKLMVLNLHKNNFTGRIPPSLCKISCLQNVDVAHNSLKGPIPHCLEKLSGMIEAYFCRHYIYSQEYMVRVSKGITLEYGTKSLPTLYSMDLSSNQLIGQIPEELTTLSLLMDLNLSHNYLSGSIPDNIGNLKALGSLDFTENKLTGIIPPSIVDLSFLGHLNLSHNNLSGRIPVENQMQTFDSSSYIGNKDLCGRPLLKNCSTISNNSYQAAADDPNKSWSHLDITCGFATGFLGVIVVLLFQKRWRHEFYRFTDITIGKIHIAVAVSIAKIKRDKVAQ